MVDRTWAGEVQKLMNRRWSYRDRVPLVKLRRRLCLTSTPALLVQRMLRWFGHAARRPEGELIKDLLLPTPPRTWRRRTGGQLKTWAGLEPLFAPRVFGESRWRKDWVIVSSESSETWSTQLVMPTQPAPSECRHKYKHPFPS